jgi:hypothetical protein
MRERPATLHILALHTYKLPTTTTTLLPLHTYKLPTTPTNLQPTYNHYFLHPTYYTYMPTTHLQPLQTLPHTPHACPIAVQPCSKHWLTR